MPSYSCTKCGKTFKQKGHYNDHINKKIDCAQNTIINTVIENKVNEKVKEVVRSLSQPKEITTETLPAFFEDLHNLLWNKAGLNPEAALQAMIFFFAYRLIEIQADTLNLPQECRWSYIAAIKSENDLFEAIKKGTTSFRNKKQTKSFFKPIEIQKAETIYEIVQQINRLSLKVLQETDTLGDIFEYMLSRGMSTMADEGQYYTNRKICKLAFKLAYDLKKTLRNPDGTLCTFADWFVGTGGFPGEYVRGVNKYLKDVDWKKDSSSIYCQDMNVSSVTTTLLNLLILTGIPFGNDHIRSANSFQDPITQGRGAPFPDLEIDYCFMNPPYGGDKTKGKEYKFSYCKKIKGEDGITTKKFNVNEDIQSIGIEDDDKVSAGAQLAMATLAPNGVCCIVLPQGFFFGASKKAVELRKKLTEEYKIHYVVDIASGSFINTGTKTSMLLFQKGVGPTEIVKFIDLEEKVLVEASLTDLRGKNYSLNYKQYLAQDIAEVEGFEMVKLGDILEFQNKPGKLGRADGKDYGKYPFYTCAQKNMFVDTCEFTKTCLIVNRGGMMNVRVDKNFSVSHDDIHVLSWIEGKTNEDTVKYIAYYLKANIKLLENGMNGTTLKHLNKSFLEEVQIPLPSLETQQQIVEAIDGWTQLAHQEEQNLKLLEKQVMFEVKEMGKGKPRVKLGEVCNFWGGKAVNKENRSETGNIPYYGSNGITGFMDTHIFDGKYIITGQDGTLGTFYNVDGKFWASNHTHILRPKDIMNILHDTLYYNLRVHFDVDKIQTGSCIPKITLANIKEFEIPLPPITEQQRLQIDFDEIKHKHEKIAQYKAKAQEAIQRLIPGATTA